MRKDLIAILNRMAATKDFPVHFGANTTLEEIRLVSDLIDRDLLDGTHVENEMGIPCNAIVRGITLTGREYVDELEDREFEKSTQGRLATCLKFGGTFLLGIIGTLLTQWIAKKLGLN